MAMVLPKEYNQSNDMMTDSTKEHFEKHKNLLKWRSNESILEFAFGDGKCSTNCLQPILPNDYKEFVAMDISKQMIEFAKKNVRIPRIHFVLEDIGNKNIPDEFENRFDHIFGLFAMHIVANPSQALKNIYKMLKPGGQTFLSFFERKPVDEALANLAKHPQWGKYGDYTSAYYYKENPRNEYEKDLQAAGFKNYTFDVISENRQFGEDENVWKNLCVSVNPAVAKIPKEEIEAYKECYLGEITNSKTFLQLTGPVGDRVATIMYNMFIVIASKIE